MANKNFQYTFLIINVKLVGAIACTTNMWIIIINIRNIHYIEIFSAVKYYYDSKDINDQKRPNH